ncbi:hypothetical protein E4U25_007895 [Claviceps purpurea]|nr:hypothetical protein E4U25_007895 [Claviceps purpurea]
MTKTHGQNPPSFSGALIGGSMDPKAHESSVPRALRDENVETISKNSSDPRSSDTDNREVRVGTNLVALGTEVDIVLTKFREESIKQFAESENKLETRRIEADELRSELQHLKQQLQHEKACCEERVAGLNTTIQELDEGKRKLREVILGNALNQRTSDEEIKQRYAALRQQIQALANNPAYDKTRQFHCDDKGTKPEVNFQKQYNSYSSADRVFLIRSSIYRILHSFILDRPVFGLPDFSSTVQSNSRQLDIDKALGDFEGLLRANKVSTTSVSEWRLATIRCIETFNPVPVDRTAARDEIWKRLEPLIKSGPEDRHIKAEIGQLCDDAFALRIVTRKSDGRYCFNSPRHGAKLDSSEGSVEVCGVLGGGETGNKVAFSICGALTKITGNGDTDTSCVLEPAHVVALEESVEEGVGRRRRKDKRRVSRPSHAAQASRRV